MTEPTTPIAPLRVAMDGPSGSGKSSIARMIAQRLDANYLDTGAMYRAATLWCMKNGIDLADESSFTTDHVVELIQHMPLRQNLDPTQAEKIMLGDDDVTAEIRTTEVSTRVAAISTRPEVRELLVAAQRATIAAHPRIIAEGRDITTVVAPDADARILLTASAEVRMARRGLQLDTTDTSTLTSDVMARDAKDSAVVDFMTPAPGVGLVDSTELNLEETLEAVLAEIRRQSPRLTSEEDL